MSNLNYRIPDDMAAEVLAEATRLHAEANWGYSFDDLQQACAESEIPSDIVVLLQKLFAILKTSDVKHKPLRVYA
jgi:hypothetical protein